MTQQVRKLVPRNTSVRVFVKDPEDVSLLKTDPLRLLTTANGSVATCQIFDDELDIELRSDAAPSDAGVFRLGGNGARHLSVGDRLWLIEDDSTVFNSDVTAIDLNAGTVTTSAALAGNATKGKKVRRAMLAAPLTLLQYGTPTQGSDAWGHSISINPDALGLLALVFNRWSIEVFMKGSAGSGNLNRTWTLLGKFDEVTEA
jgi:hypothetical protein